MNFIECSRADIAAVTWANSNAIIVTENHLRLAY